MIFLFSMLAASSAFAAAGQDPLVFREKIKGYREQELLDYFQMIKRYDPSVPYSIAAKDLNGDGVEEWILFQKIPSSCISNADCAIVIGGLSEGQIVLLGEMRGGKIRVSNEKLYGVRKLLVYNEKNNDYAYESYVWTPAEQAFRPE